MSSKYNVRLFVEGALELTYEHTKDDVLDDLLFSMTKRAAGRVYMIEVECLDEPDPLQRFFRFGTDPHGMRQPIAIDLAAIESVH